MLASSAPTYVRVLSLLLAALLLGSAGFTVVVARWARNPAEDWAFLNTHSGLKAGAGVAALWLGLGGGVAAAGCLGGFLLADDVFIEVTRRRRE
jgi:hypothetical protein